LEDGIRNFSTPIASHTKSCSRFCAPVDEWTYWCCFELSSGHQCECIRIKGVWCVPFWFHCNLSFWILTWIWYFDNLKFWKFDLNFHLRERKNAFQSCRHWRSNKIIKNI
jgi:hypothetical protein